VDFTARPARPATAATFRVPVEPALTRPVESTLPSNRPPLANQRDRKSTRLNSSHVAISYAVFCLKKKTISDRPDVSPRQATAVHLPPILVLLDTLRLSPDHALPTTHIYTPSLHDALPISVDFTARPARPATAATFRVPVEPALTRPVESTLPSNRPPLANQRITASGMTRPLESYATAWSRTVSPTCRAYSAGFTSTRAMGC